MVGVLINLTLMVKQCLSHIYLCFPDRISGYLFKRVSRTAAFLVGCSFIALQVCVCVCVCVCVHVCTWVRAYTYVCVRVLCVQGATALGIVDINWNRLRLVAQRKMSRVQQLAESSSESVTEQVRSLPRQPARVSVHH